mmetsp:Transcript_7496/g.15374  ORF Transcript_7496/g.15374 Transcript_7496/m.15374 type:complete len:97 (-) Transcript_7496:554-844(-)
MSGTHSFASKSHLPNDGSMVTWWRRKLKNISHIFELSSLSNHSSAKISADPTTMSRPLPAVASHAAATGQYTGYETEPDDSRVKDGDSTLSVVPFG